MTTILTRAFFENKRVLFRPKNAEEAIAMQRILFDMGFCWGTGSTEVEHIDKSVDAGNILKGGKLYTHPDLKYAYVECPIEDLVKIDRRTYAHMALDEIRALKVEMTARQDVIEAKLDLLLAAMTEKSVPKIIK